MFVSLNGILSKNRIKCRKDMRFMIDEFLKHFDMAKDAHLEGKKEIVDAFFNLYVVD